MKNKKMKTSPPKTYRFCCQCKRITIWNYYKMVSHSRCSICQGWQSQGAVINDYGFLVSPKVNLENKQVELMKEIFSDWEQFKEKMDTLLCTINKEEIENENKEKKT